MHFGFAFGVVTPGSMDFICCLSVSGEMRHESLGAVPMSDESESESVSGLASESVDPIMISLSFWVSKGEPEWSELSTAERLH